MLRHHVKKAEFIVNTEEMMIAKPKSRAILLRPQVKIVLGGSPMIPDNFGESTTPAGRCIVHDMGDDSCAVSSRVRRISNQILDSRQRQ